MNFTSEFSEKIEKRFAGQEVDGLLWEDFVHEDYMYVMIELHERGIKTARCDDWCAECEKESFNVEVDTDTLYWTCSHCGKLVDHNGMEVDDSE